MTDTDLLPAESAVVGVEPRSWSMADVMRFCKTIAPTEFVPKGLRDNPPAILACIMAGREMQIGPMEALGEIAVIDGKPTCSARLIRKQIMRAGHRIEFITVTNDTCTLRGIRRGGAKMEVTWTIFDAQRAGLIGTYEAWETIKGDDGRDRRHKLVWNPAHGEPEPEWVSRKGKPIRREAWTNYPRAMLLARATMELARALFPDALGSVSFEPSELGGELHPADREEEP
jgi:hypothetical protein